jgi:predicted metal-binding protein
MNDLQNQVRIMTNLHTEARQQGQLAAYRELTKMFSEIDTSNMTNITNSLVKIMKHTNERMLELEKDVKFK